MMGLWRVFWGICLALAIVPVGAEQLRTLPDFAALVARNGPAVVNISSTQPIGRSGRAMPDKTLPDDSPLYEFFRRFFGEEGEIPDFNEGRSLGSGFVLSSDGEIVTNAHVVEGAEEIIVRTSDRREFLARIVGVDPRSDIALLKIDGAENLPAVTIGAAADVPVGAWVLAIGSPFGFEQSATAGIVSAKGRSLPSENYVPFIQTDVAINPGNSGGPLFDLAGRVIGVNSQIYSRTGGFMGLSFAIPIEMVMDVVGQLRDKGRVVRGWLGVMIQDVTRDLAAAFGLSQPRGALVAQVLPESPAAQAGIREGDIILRFHGQEVQTSANLPPLVGATAISVPVEVELLRAGHLLQLQVKLVELSEEDPSAPEAEHSAASVIERLGVAAKDLDGKQRENLGLDRGVLAELVIEGSAAAQAGIRAGDLLLDFDRQPLRDTDHLRALVAKAPAEQPLAVWVQRGEGRMFYPLRLPHVIEAQ